MSFNLFFIVLLVMLLAIVFFHYLQGFFSSTLSAIYAVIAAVVAFSYHETIVEALLAGKAANTAHAMVLLMLFAVIYLTLRIISDNAIPGQVRVPAIVDKIGGALMGLVTGIFALGIVAIAAQELALGPSIAGYTRYVTNDQHVAIPGSAARHGLDEMAYDELKSDEPGNFDPDDQNSDRISVLFDDAVVNTVAHLSNGGSLEGRQPLVAFHPDFLQELFGQRIGIEPGGKGVAMNNAAKRVQDVILKGVYSIDTLKATDSEQQSIRPEFYKKVNKEMTAPKGETFLIVRVQFNGKTAADDDRLVRFSPGSVRLLVPPENSGDSATNYYPIGTLTGRTLYADKLDDFLVVNLKDADCGADLVFRVRKQGLFEGSGSHSQKIAPGTFIEIKRLAREDLSGKSVKREMPPEDPNYSVMRKTAVLAPPPATPRQIPAPTPATPHPGPIPGIPAPSGNPAQVHPNSPQSIVHSAATQIFVLESATVSSNLPIPLAIPPDTSKLSVNLPGGDAIVKNNKFVSLNVDVDQTAESLQKGGTPLKELVNPSDRALLQVVGAVPDGSWSWGDKADQFEVVDAEGKHYKANGAFAMVQVGGDTKFFARYAADDFLAPVAAQPGKITKLWLCFGVPHKSEIKQFVMGTTVIAELNDTKVP